jgi:DNA-binding response OmpR family regulator
MQMNTKILLAEDDPSLGFVIKENLILRGYEITLCIDGDQVQQIFEELNFDLCILDVMLPKVDGFMLAQFIRKKNQHIPILFTTAKSMLEDKIAGFRSGGDDYILKPFSIEELCLRMEVFLRRTNQFQANTDLHSIGDYHFDRSNLALHHPSGSKTLTQKEADVLQLLCLNRDRVLKREDILKTIWGNDDYFMGRSMDVFISKLRRYLKDDPRVQIVNLHGVGFRLELK